MNISCDSSDADFYVYSPVIATTSDTGKKASTSLGIISVGYHRFTPAEATELWNRRHL